MAFCTNCGSPLPAEAKYCPVCGAPVLAAQKSEPIRQKFSVSARPKLAVTVRTPGSINVTSGNSSEVLIDSDITEAASIDYKATQEGNLITITSRAKSWNPLIWGSYVFSGGARANIRVSAPPEADLTLETITDPISVTGISGMINAESKTGPIRLKECSGTIDVRTHTGNIDLDDVSGVIEARDTIGHVNYIGSMASGNNAIRTTTGDIDVGLRGEPDLTLDASTTVGHIVCRIDMAESRFDRGQYVGQHVAGKLGQGRGRLILEATTGSISVYKQ